MYLSEKIDMVSREDREGILGRTLPSLINEACDRHPNQKALNHWTSKGWQSLSNRELKIAAVELARELSNLKLERGDRVALLMHDDINFCIADLGCLFAGMVTVPIDLTQTLENIIFILRHAEVKILIVSNLDLLYQVIPYLWEASNLQAVVVAEVPDDWQKIRAELLDCHSEAKPKTIPAFACLRVPTFICEANSALPCPPPPFPECIQLFSLAEIRVKGRELQSSQRAAQLPQILATDLATIIYTAGPTREPRGVMLTHENISADILTSFNCHPGLEKGDREIVLLFLPLTHILARAFLYGHLNYGHSIYFSTPSYVSRHLKEIQPTIFLTVPRLLEKAYQKIVEKGSQLKGLKKIVFNWAIGLAKRYRIDRQARVFYALQLKIADRLVFSKWRANFGFRLKALFSGGAALKADLANIFSAAGIPVFQGYGLTETSAVVCYNRGQYNRAGTVGIPIPGVEIAIASDGEILVRGPIVTQGYYKNPEATRAAFDRDGWFHTGDLGRFTEEGLLEITGLKKSLFKLATGKYVTSQPLENQLKQSPLVQEAIAVGAGEKFCGMLIFADLPALSDRARAMEIDLPADRLLKHPCIIALYQALVDEANCHLPHWSTVKKFQLINATLTTANAMLTPNGKVNRARVIEVFAPEIEAMYGSDRFLKRKQKNKTRDSLDTSCPTIPDASCPAFAQSLTHN